MTGRLIGESFIAILPETAAFRSQADEQIKRQLGTLNPKVRVGADTAQANTDIARLAALIKSQKFNDINLGLDTRAAMMDLAGFQTAANALKAKLENIPMSMDDSAALSKVFNITSAVTKLQEQLGNMDADGDFDALLGKFYGLEEQTKQLQANLSHLDPNMNADEAINKLASLRADADQLNAELHAITVDPNDTPALAKFVKIEATISAMAKQMMSMPMDADTLPIEAKLLAVRAQIAALDTAVNSVGASNGLGSVDLASAMTSFESMDTRVKQINQYLQQTGDVGSQSFGQLNAAIGDVNRKLAELHEVGIGPDQITEVKSLDAALKTLASDTGLAAEESKQGAQGFGILGRALAAIRNTSIPLYGGALEGLAPKFLADASGLHLITEAIVEITAVWGPALLGLTLFGALAYKTGKDVYTQFMNMNTVVSATGQTFADTKTQIKGMENAIQPEVMVLWGEYLNSAGQNGAHLTSVMQELGKGLDFVGAKMQAWFDNDKSNAFLSKAAEDAGGLADAFKQLGSIIHTLLQAVPGYAQILLHMGDAFLTVLADATKALEPVIALFLKFHGAEFYIGLATTAILGLGRAMAGAAIASYAKGMGIAIGDAGIAAESANGKFNKIGTGLGSMAGAIAAAASKTVSYSKSVVAVGQDSGLAAGASKVLGDAMDAIPFGPVGLVAAAAAVAIGVGLYFSMRNTTDAAQKFTQQMQALITASNIANIQGNLQTAVTKTTQKIDQQTLSLNKLSQESKTALSKGQDYAALNAGVDAASTNLAGYNKELNTAMGQVENYGSRMNTLTGVFGSNASAQAALNVMGISAGKIATENNSTWQTQLTELEGLAKGYGYMSQSGNEAANQLNTLNIASGTTTKNIQALTQAESAWITLVTGGDSAFTSFEQGQGTLADTLNSKVTPALTTSTTASTKASQAVTNLAKGGKNVTNSLATTTSTTTKAATAANTLSVSVGKITEKFSLAGASMNGTSQASLAARQAFDAQIAAGQTLYGNLQQLSAASGNGAQAQRELGQAGKDIIGQLLPMAAGSKEATAEVYALAQVAGYTGPDSFKKLAQWVGNAKNAEGDLNKQQTALTISSANVTQAAKNLGNALQTTITNAEASALAMKAGLVPATQNLAKVAGEAHDKVNSLSTAAATQFYNAMRNSGVSVADATDQLNAYLKQLGFGPGAIKQIDAAIQNNTQSTNKQAGAQKYAAQTAQDMQNSFMNLAENGLHLTANQATALWQTFAKNDLGLTASNADSAHQSFMKFATQGLDISNSAAQSLWNTIAKQNLATAATKAGETKTQFDNLATSLGVSTTNANNLWNALHKLPANTKVNVQAQLLGTGQIKATDTIMGGSTNLGELNFGKGMAGGGIVPPGGSPAGVDGNAYRLAPGELVIPTSHASKFAAAAKTAGVPGLASGGVAGGTLNTSALDTTLGNIQGTAANASTQFGQQAATAFVKQLQQAQASAAGGPSGGKYSGGGSILSIAKWFEANGANAAAAAGIASVIYGESGGNPESREVGGSGWGLIQWTGNTTGLPGGYSGPTGNESYDMGVQLRGALGYINSRGGLGKINAAGSPILAGNVFSGMEAPAVALSDTRPAEALAIYAQLMGASAGQAASVGNAIGKTSQVRPHSTGGTINERVEGRGQTTGYSYVFGENGPEVITPAGQLAANANSGMPTASLYGQNTTNALLAQLVKLMQQQPANIGRAIGSAGSSGLQHGFYGAQNLASLALSSMFSASS